MINSIGRNAPSPMGQVSGVVSGKSGNIAAAHVASQNPKTETVSAAPHSSAAIEGSAPIDLERVAQIKATIDAGAYPVDSEQLADAMLNWGKTIG
ncbi:MAG: flagellar biosynthesis anti-sigma factor FlgM [Sphingopyxis sp.]